MKKKNLDYIAVGIFVVLLVGSLLINIGISGHVIIVEEDDGLSWYRSNDVPIDCRLPEYEGDLEAWKKNLRHNQETWYCLKYFE